MFLLEHSQKWQRQTLRNVLLDTNGYANDKHVKLIAQSFYMPKLHDF